MVSDLKVKYQSSVLGFAWSLLNPLLMMLVLYFVFSNVFRFEVESFALYILIGIIVWRFLVNGTMTAMGSIVGRPGLVTKIFIPRQILVLSSVLSAFISSILEFLVLIPLLFILGAGVTVYILLFPIVHVIYLLLVYGVSLFLASLYVYYRDLNQIWDVVLQAGFFLSPIVYPISVIPTAYIGYYMLNPMTMLMEIYRDFLLYGSMPSLLSISMVFVAGCLIAFFGSLLFHRLERRFAEVI
ncbi:ABC transporter permease [Methanocalculus sp.]|uniref:ABC transporter permease n=1 Tax=Methanocalculus sp. TaxID=2004547 RepID=UPI0027250DBE|nr:ABC transporter permease [Methanocalculus sp.]MDO8842203.1 ABC transporter permease [Methanocalculus sp.]